MINTIESDDISFGKLYEDYYAVPDYQREFVWEERQVEQLLEDILEEFQDAEDKPRNEDKPEYFVGSIVVCKNEEGIFDLIDGQQRTTTTFLLLCAIRDLLEEVGQQPMAELVNKISYRSTDMEGNENDRYRLQLQYKDSGNILREIAERTVSWESNGTDTRSISNIKSAYQTIIAFLRRNFLEDPAMLRRFYAYFVNKVKIIRIETGSVAHALKIFETINDRGQALDAMDLLKNLMFMNASQQEFEDLKNNWKELIDILYQAKEKPLRFLRYFIFSSYDVERLKEDEIYQWFSKNAEQCGYRKDPLGFVRQLLQAAHCYKYFIEGKDTKGNFNRYIDNVRYASYSARQHLILLLAARHLPTDAFNLLAKNVENLFFVYIVVREATKDFERRFAIWASTIRGTNNKEDIQQFLNEKLIPTKNSFSGRFNSAFLNLTDQGIQQYRMRYILGKLAQYLQEIAYGSGGTNHQLSTFINRNVDVEHILPKDLTEESVNEFDERDIPLEEKFEEASICLHKLGNLTWFEKSLNASQGNRPFSQKRISYGDSIYLLTSSIYSTKNVGVNTAIDRALSKLMSFEIWNKDSVERRQRLLTMLAQEVWGMPRSNMFESEGNG